MRVDALKVLFVLPEYGAQVRGGIARFYQHAVAGLRSAGCQADVCIASSDVSEVIADDVPIRRLEDNAVMRAEGRLSHLALFPALRRQLAIAFAAYDACSGGDGYDVVEVTDWGLLYVPWLAQGQRRAPVVVQLHGSPGQIGYKDPLIGEELSALLTRALEVTYLPRADDLQTYGIANALDWQHLLDMKVRHMLPAWPSPRSNSVLPASTAFGAVAGRLQSWKGPELLCKACRALGERSPTIFWAGADHPFQRLDQSMSDYLMTTYPEIWGRKIIPLGSQPHEITRSVQNAASFVVHPSSWDVFAFAVVEAMEVGKVVICSDQAGASCLIEHGENGFVYPGEDFSRLAELLQSVSELDQPTLLRLGENARRTIAEKLDMQKVTALRLASYAALRPHLSDVGHPWLTNVFGPRAAGGMTEAALLDNMPLKLLLNYVTRRLARRFIPAKRRVTLEPLPSRDVTALLDSLAKGGAQ
jgi:glycosyltransferase involved in cell wall biosynthesis